MSKKKQEIIPIELSQEDIRLLEEEERNLKLLRDMIIQFSMIPKEYFGGNIRE
jgi:hypothetical protein